MEVINFNFNIHRLFSNILDDFQIIFDKLK